MVSIHDADVPASTLKQDDEERPMSDDKSHELKPSDLKVAAKHSQDAITENESAAYEQAFPTEGGSEEKESEGHPS
jgi:hypothetical protein